MARIPKLDAAGKFLAADVNAQIDARAKAATAPLLDGKRGVEATELGTEHLDTVTTPGTYTQSANLEATLETGYPMTRGGVLQVERSVSKTMVWQTYTTYAPSPSTPAQTWQRGSYNGTWTPWAKVGGGSGGGVYYDKDGKAVRYVYVMSDTDPGKTRVVDGETVEVWWVQTAPPDPSKWVPAVPSFDMVKKSYTIPADDGATYTVHGVKTPAGTYFVTPPETVNVNAVPKPGYAFASGAVTAWSKVYEEAPLPMDTAASAVSAPFYYRLDEAGPAYRNAPKNRGTSTASPWHSNSSGNFFTYGQTPAAGVGPVAVSTNASGSRWWLDDSTVPTAFTIAVAVNFQGTSPGFGLTRDWAQAKRTDFSPAPATVAAGNATLTPGVHHVAYTWDGATKRVYVDGAEVSSVAMTAWPTTSALVLFEPMAGSTNRTTSTFAGLVIDRARAMTAAQIKTLSDAVTR